MTKEELVTLGVSDEIAEKVLVQHTAELTAQQQKTTDITAELTAAK
mgnify:CR=1 FL=1|jgi:hypothetical protein